MLTSLYNILLQTAQPLLGGLQNIIILAYGKPEIILRNVGIGVSVELGWRNGRNANLMNEEPAKLEVAGAACNMRREWVTFRQLD